MQINRGSEWRRWELHLHTPFTKKEDNYSGETPDEKWDNFYANVTNPAMMLRRRQGKGRVQPETGALVLKKGHGKKADQGICKKKTIQRQKFMLLYR